jgi:hypothetical protein
VPLHTYKSKKKAKAATWVSFFDFKWDQMTEKENLLDQSADSV